MRRGVVPAVVSKIAKSPLVGPDWAHGCAVLQCGQDGASHGDPSAAFLVRCFEVERTPEAKAGGASEECELHMPVVRRRERGRQQGNGGCLDSHPPSISIRFPSRFSALVRS